MTNLAELLLVSYQMANDLNSLDHLKSYDLN